MSGRPWKERGFLDLLWIDPDGNVTRDRIRAGPWVGSGTTVIHPTKAGYFVTRDSTPENVAYLVTPTSHTLVLEGDISGVQLSPDGCRVSVNFALERTPDRRRTLIVIDLCEIAADLR